MNFDKPYAFNFEKGRIRLKKLLMFEPNLINQLDNGKDFKGLAFGLRASNENVNTENINNNYNIDRRAPPAKKNHLTRSVERSNNNIKTSSNKSNSKVRSVDKKSVKTCSSNLRGSYNQPKSTMSKKNNLRASGGGVASFKKSNTNVNNRQYNFMDEREEEDYNEAEDDNNYDYDEFNYNNSKNLNLRGSNYSKKSTGTNYKINSSMFKSKPKSKIRRNQMNNEYYDNNEEEEETFKGSNMSFKPNIELERYNNNMYNEEEEEEEDDKKNFAKEQLKEITIRFKLTEEEYRLLLREKAKIVVQLPSSTKHKTNRVINKKAY